MTTVPVVQKHSNRCYLSIDAWRHVQAPSRQGRRRLEALYGTGALGALSNLGWLLTFVAHPTGTNQSQAPTTHFWLLLGAQK